MSEIKTAREILDSVAKKYRYKNWLDLHIKVGGTEMDAFIIEAMEEYMIQENNNEVVYKWVKVKSEKDLPDNKPFKKYLVRYRSISDKYMSLTHREMRDDFLASYEIEWLKEIKPVPQSLPIKGFQDKVYEWLIVCFGEEISNDKVERNHRFLEESLELVQSLGCTKSEAMQLVDYVFDREIGDPVQELGGVMVTLAALCPANKLNMNEAAEIELARIWTKIDKIREKQANKPTHSPLPQSLPISNDKILDILNDTPGISWDCDNNPKCKCREQNKDCVNLVGMAKKIEEQLSLPISNVEKNNDNE